MGCSWKAGSVFGVGGEAASTSWLESEWSGLDGVCSGCVGVQSVWTYCLILCSWLILGTVLLAALKVLTFLLKCSAIISAICLGFTSVDPSGLVSTFGVLDSCCPMMLLAILQVCLEELSPSRAATQLAFLSFLMLYFISY